MRKRSALVKGGAWFVAALAVLGLFAAPVIAKPPVPGPNAPGQSGFTGPAGARVDSVNVPARIFRVAVVPGSNGNDVWAMGYATSYTPGWNRSDLGQLVFLRNQNKSGWKIVGPAKSGSANDTTSAFNAFALASTPQGTEGWAVGAEGKIAHLAPGTNEWVTMSLCPQITCTTLNAIALRKDGSLGYAAGEEGTVLRLANGSWTADPAIAGRGSSGADTTPVTGPTGRPGLSGVALAANGEAWAIASTSSDPNSRGIELYRRNNSTGAWEFRQTGNAALDNGSPTPIGDDVRVAVHGTAAAADGTNTIWFAGYFFPVDPANPNGDPSTGGTSQRPIIVRYKDGAFTAYCTPGGLGGAASGTAAGSLCGAGSGELPPAPFPMTSLSTLDNGEVFAGGVGLYHYKPGTGLGRWFREPNPVGFLMSVAFGTNSEGWMVGTGGSFGGELTSSSSIAIGHYTRQAAGRERVARWAFPTETVAYAVATSPDGVAPPIAVGEAGVVMTKTSLGWDKTGEAENTRGEGFTQLAVAYAGNSGVAWAVGEAGKAVAIENGAPKNPYPQLRTRGSSSNDTLYGVAFAGPGLGYAVGASGSIVRYAGGAWAADSDSGRVTTETLWGVAAIGGTTGFVAVGEKGTVLVNPTGADDNWTKASYVSDTLLKPPVGFPPPLYAVDSLPDGTIVIGGGRSALIVRQPGAPLLNETNPIGAQTFTLAPTPHEGTILALSARTSNPLRLVASLVPDGTAKFDASKGATSRGWLVDFDGTHWSDLQRSSNRVKPMTGLDDVMSRDPVYAIATDADGRSGWAVGGRWAGQGGQDGTRYDEPTRSMYRFDLDQNPSSPLDVANPITPDTPSGGFSFAFFSDTACGQGPMLCSLSAGTGTAADEIALRIREDINAAHAKDPVNGPQFVLFGGNARGSGSPEELGQFAAYLSGFDIPVFGVPGRRDLTPPAGTTSLVPGVPFNLAPQQPASSPGDLTSYLQAFGAMPAPWGSGPKERDNTKGVVFEPVGGGASCAGCARTHYAFDYMKDGKALARFVFLDTSDGTLNTTNQNPAESQSEFIQRVLPGSLRGRLPSFIVMNTPTRDPSTFSNTPILPPNDITTIEQLAYTAGTSAVFAGGIRTNTRYTSPEGFGDAVTYYVSGAGGSPLDGTGKPSDARYHSWLLASVDPNVSTLRPQARTTVRSIPVIESVYFLKPPGWVGQPVVNVDGGTAVMMTAAARGIDGGGRVNDPKAMNRMYIGFPLGYTCEGGGDQPINTGCFNKRGIPPDFRFISENPAIADFVYSGGSFSPVRSNGRLVKDPMSGLLCTFRTGQVWVRIESGGRVGRLQLNVVPGKGPCVVDAVTEFTELPTFAAEPDPVPDVRPAPNQPPAPATPKPAKITPPTPPTPKPVVPTPPQPEPAPVAKPVPKVFLAPSPLAEIVPALMPPAPSLLPSPAPPASATAAGAQKQEDKEVQHESASEEGGDFTAISHRRDYAFDPAMGWMLMSVAALLGVFGAGIAATKKGGAGRPAHARVTYPRELQ